MSDADRYLKRLDGIQRESKESDRKARFRKAREIYRERTGPVAPDFFSDIVEDYREDPKYLRKQAKKDPGEMRATAYQLMTRGNADDVLFGAQIYQILGKGRRAIPKLLRAMEEDPSSYDHEHIQAAKRFINRNTSGGVVTKIKKRFGSSDTRDSPFLEKRVGVFIFMLLGGIALSVYSLSITGNVIGNLTGTTPGLLGVFLFIAGLAGMAFWVRRK